MREPHSVRANKGYRLANTVRARGLALLPCALAWEDEKDSITGILAPVASRPFKLCVKNAGSATIQENFNA